MNYDSMSYFKDCSDDIIAKFALYRQYDHRSNIFSLIWSSASL
jgi:hypothetical protein